jgi:NADP-dependent 3-hydroxy acid dehydrogenase YdfG
MTENPLAPDDVAATVQHVLEAPPNHLISEVVVRPLRPHRKE